MSSCFLCDCSYKFLERDKYDVYVQVNHTMTRVRKYMKQVPIMIGSSGTELDDQQHDNSKKQNYFPYRVKKIEFCCSVNRGLVRPEGVERVDCVLMFKVPFREPLFDYNFLFFENFMLYSEPECVLDYKILPVEYNATRLGRSGMVKININKPFIIGPNEYVGVFYMIDLPQTGGTNVDASAKVWFDTA